MTDYGDALIVPLARRGRRLQAIVDRADAPLLVETNLRWTWDGRYARATGEFGSPVYLHMVVMGRKPGDEGEVDHINGNKLDNRRSNLRVVPHVINARNLHGGREGTSSKYRGVSWNTRSRNWEAFACHDGVKHNLGRYDVEEEAAKVVHGYWLDLARDTDVLNEREADLADEDERQQVAPLFERALIEAAELDSQETVSSPGPRSAS